MMVGPRQASRRRSRMCTARRGERLVFAGDALFPATLGHSDWPTGVERDPEEAMRVRIGLSNETASTWEILIATRLRGDGQRIFEIDRIPNSGQC